MPTSTSVTTTYTVPYIALCSGEPAGIGPDLCLLYAEQFNTAVEQQKLSPAILICLASTALLEARAKALQTDITFIPVSANALQQKCLAPLTGKQLYVLEHKTQATVEAGTLNTANSHYVLDILNSAIQGCQNQLFSAMVTAPVQKSVINEAGISFSGHTEYLAEHTHTSQVVMMLASSALRVCLATTHLPLKDVADNIHHEQLVNILRIMNHDLKHYFGLEQPHILVCGLNPHAGEDGHLGTEEIDTIIPAIKQCQAEGLNITGPLAADTLFTEKHLRSADAVLAMYHDQGLPVLKYQGFGKAANITLGLPIIRTSVDHGTALDLAATGNIHLGSLHTACQQAIIMASAKG